MTQTMKAVRIHQYGEPEVLIYAVFALSAAAQAHMRGQQGHTRGKTVLRVVE